MSLQAPGEDKSPHKYLKEGRRQLLRLIQLRYMAQRKPDLFSQGNLTIELRMQSQQLKQLKSILKSHKH